MKLALLILLMLAGTAGRGTPRRPPPAPDAALRVMTFNIRFDNPADGPNAWPHRKDLVASMIRFHRADLVGVQEALKHQLDDLQERLPGYAWTGVGRADGREGGEYSAIVYRKDRFELLESGTFWLSPTPDVPGSKGWDAALERIVTWAKLRDRTTGRVFVHFNTHFDHIGAEARAESAKLLRQRLAAAGPLPLLLTGDFNATDETMPYRILSGAEPGVPAPSLALHDAMRSAEYGHHGPTSTWNGFDAVAPGRRIDFIFVGDGVHVRQHGILADTWDGRFPSDHLPVLAEVVLP
jgi:endonuclease/exonuclease/phosphatase family metal-dependent hydrolase